MKRALSKSRLAAWILMGCCFFPIGIMLFIQSLGWPNNFDDFYRGFNGISTEHDVLHYGWIKSQEMLKHLAHDPLLTWSNQFDYRWPTISGLIETIFLISFMSIVTNTALRGGNKHAAFSIILLFNLFVGVQAYTFLPPAAFPLAFTASFLVTTLSNLRFNGLSKEELQTNTSASPSLKKLSGLALVILEQLAFLFYACNFVQSVTFWIISNIQRAFYLNKNGTLKRAISSPSLWSGCRLIPFVIINVIWRINNGADGAETLSRSLNIVGAVKAGIKWNLAGTNLGGYVGMLPEASAPWSQPLWIITLSALVGALTFSLGRWIIGKEVLHKTTTIASEAITLNLLLLGVSILIGWTTPALSERYYHELSHAITQTYVASRFASLGLLLAISIPIGALISRSHAKSWQIALLVIVVSSTSIAQNITSLSNEFDRSSLKRSDVCDGKGNWNEGLLLPKEIIAPGVDTSHWLTTYKGPSSDITIETKRQAAIEIFERNSSRFCW